MEDYGSMKKLIVLIFSFIFGLCLCSCSNEATSIGIIGGADGPTSISVTSNLSWLSVCGFIGIIVAIIFIIFIIYRNKKKK